MEREIPKTSFQSIKPPTYEYTKKQVDKKKYLDEIFTKEWINKYFTTPDK